MSERLAGKPAAEEASTNCAIDLRAWRLSAACGEAIDDLLQALDSFEMIDVGIPPHSCVGHRFKAIASWQTVGTQSRNVALSRNWQAEDDLRAFARGDVLRDAFGARRVVGVHGAVFRCRTSAAAPGSMHDIAA